MQGDARIRVGPADIVLAVACVPPTIGGALSRDGSFGPFDALVIVVTVALVLLRRWFPIPVLAAGVVALPASVAVTDRPNGLFPAVIILVFAVAARYERRVAVFAGLGGMGGLLGVILILGSHGLAGPQALAAIAWPGFAAAAGQVVRSRRLAVAAAEERALRAEEAREEEARRRVAEERLHIARELHDVVAHRLAVVNVQAGVAEHLMGTQPAAAAEALRVVRSAAQTALDELAGILDVLRTTDGAPTEPAPTMAELTTLIDSFRDAGLDVAWATTGAPRPLGGAAQLAVYRTVQEALTNAHKHGEGRARVTVTHGPEGVDVEVVNAVARSAGDRVPGSGFGLVGMRERISAVGGRLDVGAADGTFRVAAHIPSSGSSA